MLTRTYPSEIDVLDADELIVKQIREKMGDQPKLVRYIVKPGSDAAAKYIMDDNLTFYNDKDRFWPYNVTVSGTTYSGIDNPQILNYHYLTFSDPVQDLTQVPLDLWVETFFISDYEIWTTYLSIDLTPLVRNPACITENMNAIKAAIELIPVLRELEIEWLYATREVTDGDQKYRSTFGTIDPYKDRLRDLQAELQRLIDMCNKKPYFGGIRLE